MQHIFQGYVCDPFSKTIKIRGLGSSIAKEIQSCSLSHFFLAPKGAFVLQAVAMMFQYWSEGTF